MKPIPENYQPPKIQYGESDKLKTKIGEYAEIKKKRQFMKLYYASFEIIKGIKDAFPLYFYMCNKITRGRSSYLWWNEIVLPYFYDGYLPFAKHNSHIAKDLGLSRTTIGRQLDLLENAEIIVRLAEESYPDKKDVTIWSMGRWEDTENGREEYYYLQALSF